MVAYGDLLVVPQYIWAAEISSPNNKIFLKLIVVLNNSFPKINISLNQILLFRVDMCAVQ